MEAYLLVTTAAALGAACFGLLLSRERDQATVLMLQMHGIMMPPFQIVSDYHGAAGRPLGRREAKREAARLAGSDPDRLVEMYFDLRDCRAGCPRTR